MPPRPTHTPALLLAVLVLLGHLAQVLHQAAHLHVFCAAHDRVEHAGHGGRDCHGGPEQPAEPVQPGGGEEDGHETCPFLPPGLSSGPEAGRAEPARALPRTGTPPAPRQPLYAEVLWLLAPKHSPPVTV